MKIFEFHFNPGLKDDLIFESFCYEPSNIYEKKLGSLYLVGMLKNALPQNVNFLERLARFIKDKFFQKILFKSEKALRETLKEANEFLREVTKKGDVSWLGNLSFAVLNFLPLKNFDWEINFTKVGEMKVCLVRGKKIIDIDRKLKLQQIEPYPLKIFGNSISGKLLEGDMVLVLNKEIFDFFEREGLFSEIGKIFPPDEKEFKRILAEKKEKMAGITGLSLFIFLSKEILKGKKEEIFSKPKKEFSFSEFSLSFLKFFKKIFLFEIKLSEGSEQRLKLLFTNKKFLLVLTFFFVLFLGALLAFFKNK
jgi:hypothetical protein